MTRKSVQAPEQVADNARALGSAVGDFWKSFAGLKVPIETVSELQTGYVQQATELWNQTLTRAHPEGDAKATPSTAISDKRFNAPEWMANPATAYTAQMYLLNARTLMQLAESIEGDPKTRARVRFGVQQWIDAMSPANFMALNPEAQKKALDTKGESVAQGMRQLWTTCARVLCRRLTKPCSRSAATSRPAPARWCSRTTCSSSSNTSR